MTAEGKEIGYRHWGLSAPRAVFVLVHGLGAHGGRWEPMADFFQKKGISSYAIELRNPAGQGRTGILASYFRGYRDSVLRLYDIAAANHPGKKIFIIGESMGALIAFLLAAEQPGLFNGLVCISPAFVTRVKLALVDYLAISACVLSNSNRQFKLPFDSSMCTRDPHIKHRMDADSLEYRHAPAKLLVEFMVAQARVKLAARRVTTPTLFLLAGEDRIADPAASAKVFSGIPAADKALMEFPGMYHALSVELGRESVFEELLKWVDKRI